MTRHVFIFLATFAVGALVALTVRAARFNGDPAPVATSTSSTSSASTATAAPAVDPHAQHTIPAATALPAPDAKPVNTLCAVCGMEVDSDLPTAVYQGKTIGFGCKACPAKFAANPAKYGPAFLRNEVVK